MKKTFCRILAVASFAVCSLTAMAGDGVTIHQLGDRNTLVRIDGGKRYLIMPVQESMPDAKVDILVNGNVVRTIFVRLADSQIDYRVPLDITPYAKQGKVMLNIISEVDRTHSREASDFVCWEEMTLADGFDTTNREQYRPGYHHTPLWGWMNDPNGMFYKDGVWHLYFQSNPYGSKWQNMTWGHSTSTDLVRWKQQPNAIEPNGLGSVFSGSCAIDHDNTAGFGKGAVIAMYTSAGHSQVQSLAYSTDGGATFTNYDGNPVIPNRREMRDPNMFWHAASGKWVLLLANALEQEMVILSSKDLKEWKEESHFGKGYGSQFGVWECPDMFELPVLGTKQRKWVLVCNINPGGPFGGSATQYFVGTFDGSQFVCESPAYVSKWMDYGKDHYATVSWSDAPDGRRTVIGWMSNWQYANDVPTQQFRSANTLPRDLALFVGEDGETYLSVQPSPEVETLRGAVSSHEGTSVGAEPVAYALPDGGMCEIDLDYNLKGCTALDVELGNDEGERVTMSFDVAKREFSMDRSKSGIVKFSRHFPATTIAPTHNTRTNGTLRLFVDRCSVEAFDGEGRFAMTNLVFPTKPYTRVTVRAQGGKAKVNGVKVYPMKQ
mgnify:CR=1 FL=1